MTFLPSKSLLLASFLALSGALVGGPPARPVSSLSDLDLETAEAKLTLEKTLQENLRLKEEVARLKEKQVVSDASATQMAASVAMANDMAEIFRRQLVDSKLRLEALGLSAASGNTGKLEERVLEALKSYTHAEEERKKVSEALAGLCEAAAGFAKKATAAEPDSRLALEVRIRRANELLGLAPSSAVEAGGVAATLTDGMVISIKEELGLVVANIGVRQGVAVGMPFQVIRDDHLIGMVRVVDARDRIAGAIIQDLSSTKDKIKVGDRLKVAARQ